MMKKTLPSLILVLFLSSGCAMNANKIPTSGATASTSKMQCDEETPIGSRIPVKRCRTEDQIKKDKEDAKVLRRQQPRYF